MQLFCTFYLFLDINECASNPCLNAAACTNQVNGFQCTCEAGYQGVRCEAGTYCSKLCLFGGFSLTIPEEFGDNYRDIFTENANFVCV